jgi:ribonucleoside-triphosphate reductase
LHFTDTGRTVYERTYSRTLPNGAKEEWVDTVKRVVAGNLSLGDVRHELLGEADDLIRMMTEFKIIPAGRHLWTSGVRGAQGMLMNCWVSGWGEQITDHFEFTFLRLMEGGGVGANYSNRHLERYSEIQGHQYQDFDNGPLAAQPYSVHIVCDPSHPDYQKMKGAGLLSEQYVSDWDGCYEVADSREGWADALTDLIETYYRPAKNVNRVFDVSRVREEGARLKTFGGSASGPLPLARMLHEVAEVFNSRIGLKLDGIGAMEVDHAIATCVVSGGVRRSARMAMMHWNDPQINEFLKVKETSGKHWTTNISVEVDSEFWFWIKNRREEGVLFDAQESTAEDQACTVLEAVTGGMLANGEPGIWNHDYANDGEPNEVIATNPCGEIALEAWEPCNLGHVNIAAFVDPNTGLLQVNELYYAHELMTRYLIRATNAPIVDPKSREVLSRNRRIGVGHLGVASFLAMRGIKYSDAPRDAGFINLLESLADTVTATAVDYSHDLRIPVPVKTRTVAPTGTIAKMPGVSEGIHPIMYKYFVRRIRFSNVDESQRRQVEEYAAKGYIVEPCQYAPMTTVVAIPTRDILVEAVAGLYGEERAEELVEASDELSLEQMLAFQALYQRVWADNAVSYTVNVTPGGVTPEALYDELASVGPRLKGTTVFPALSHQQAPYERISKAEFELYEFVTAADGVDENCSSGSCPIR